jgi:hypothetical protein
MFASDCAVQPYKTCKLEAALVYYHLLVCSTKYSTPVSVRCSTAANNKNISYAMCSFQWPLQHIESSTLHRILSSTLPRLYTVLSYY